MSGSEPVLNGDSSAGATARPRLVCVSTDADAAAVLQHVVQAIFPAAQVGSADTGILRDPPDAECVILSVGGMYASAEPLARGLRARGFRKALVVVADIPSALETDQLTLLGIGEVVATRDLAISLPSALARQLDLQEAAQRSPLAGRLLDSARELQALVAFRVGEVPVRHRARKYGQSKFGASRFVNGFLDLLSAAFLSTSALKPLHLFGRVGLLFLMIGAGLGVYFVVLWIGGEPIRVRPLMLFGAGLVLLGIQFILMGLLGEMIARIHAPRADYPVRARYNLEQDAG